MTQAYPLQWPAGWKRTDPSSRKAAKFAKSGAGWQTDAATQRTTYDGKKPLTIADAVRRVMAELDRMGVPNWNVVISANLKLREDGLPLSRQAEPNDPGVAVYFHRRDEPQKVMAIDIYDRVADNLAAVAATIDAMRAIERHGGAKVMERAFTGFTALSDRPHWATVLGVSPKASSAEVNIAFRMLAAKHHPDRAGGNAQKMAEITEARDRALKEMGLA